MRIGACAVVVTGVALFVRQFFTERPFGAVLREAKSALSQADFRTARRLAHQLLERSPESTEALLVSAQASLQLGFCTESEQALCRVLAHDGTNVEAHLSLVRLLKMEGRYGELRPHALSLLRSGDSGNEYLIPLAAPDDVTLSESEFARAEFCRMTVSDDALPLLGIARHFLQNAEFAHADAVLREIAADGLENIEAQALLGTAMLRLGQSEDFLNWHERLPATADGHAEIWFLRGTWARSNRQPRAAIRCFWEAVLRDPNHRRANFQLSQTLVFDGEPDQSKKFAERFARLEEVSRLATHGNDSSRSALNARTMLRIATVMERLGRLWEAAGWYRKAIEHDPQLSVARRQLEEVTGRIDDTTPLTLGSSNPARLIDLSAYPLPDWHSDGGNQRSSPNSLPAESSVSFSDRAESLGLKFRFHNGANPASGHARMFEFSGGGVAVLDYDGDFWPDLYLTQGCAWPLTSGGRPDRLFRNVNGERFEDVTEQSGLGDERYSQGATVGDFNNDGFPDICLANIGANRLYRNNGDGTFTDVGEAMGIGGDEWTLSCLLADVNGDTLPDLYCVNYLGGKDVFTRKCESGGRSIQCPLHYFPSAQDRLYRNLGDGRFQDVTETSGIAIPEGKGMGIVAANFHRSGRLSLFIANDDKPNFLFVDNMDNTKRRDRPISYFDKGVISGLAFGDLGTAQSSMGVAAGDANNDGLLDLFVTNYTGEHNNFYVQRPGVIFEDVSRPAGLHLATLPPMGWGTQFLDGDLDGLLDIVVANGHLDKNTAGKLPYKMPAQYFRNLGENRFAELSADRLGPYFKRPHAGRAVARIDWNRDGANDVCVTHVESPVALLSNQTLKRGHYLSIHLRGVACSRDAIGSVVRITAADKSWFRHLTAGDGFQASNERKLTFGFGNRQRIDQMTIYWPSGFEQTLPGPDLDTEILIIEGNQPRTLNAPELGGAE